MHAEVARGGDVGGRAAFWTEGHVLVASEGARSGLDGLVNRHRKRAGEAASGNTKRLHRGAVQAWLKYAYRQRHVPELPDLARFRIEGSTKTVVKKPDPLTLEELMRMMEVSRAVHRCLWAVGACEGCGLGSCSFPSVTWGHGHQLSGHQRRCRASSACRVGAHGPGAETRAGSQDE